MALTWDLEIPSIPMAFTMSSDPAGRDPFDVDIPRP